MKSLFILALALLTHSSPSGPVAGESTAKVQNTAEMLERTNLIALQNTPPITSLSKNWVYENNVDYAGEELMTRHHLDHFDCLRLCETTPNCVAVTRDKSSHGACTLRKTITLRGYNQVFWSGAINGTPGLKSMNYYQEHNMNYADADVGMYGYNKSVSECYDQCATIQGCAGFTVAQAVCYFKATLHTPVYSYNAVSYIQDNSMYNRTYLIEHNTWIEGTTLMYWKGPWSHCFAECTSTTGCVSFTLDVLNGMNCWLKSSAASKVFKLGYTSYAITSKTDRVFIPQYNQKYSGNNLLYWKGPFEMCDQACLSTPGCLAYSLDYAAGQNCLLKSALNGAVVSQYSVIYTIGTAVRDQPRKYTPEWNVQYVGGDLFFTEGELEDCALTCDQTDSCIAFTWNPALAGCFLKTELTRRSFVAGVATYVLPGYRDHRYIHLSNVYYSTTNSIATFHGSVSDCQGNCSYTPECVGFIQAVGNTCILLKELTGRTYRANSDVYVADSFLDDPEYVMELNVIYPGNDLLYYIGPFDMCAAVCTLTPLCVAVQWDTTLGRNCYFKSDLSQATYNVNATTLVLGAIAIREAILQPMTKCASPIVTLATGYTSCSQECTGTCGCVAYVESNGNCALYDINSQCSNDQISYVYTLSPAPMQRYYIEEDNVAYPGEELLFWIGPHSLCDSACDYTQGCVGYTLDINNGSTSNCWLLESMEERIYTTSTISYGIPQAALRTFISLMNVDLPGNDLYYYDGVHNKCPYACSLYAGCIAFTLDMTASSGCWFKSDTPNNTTFRENRVAYIMSGYGSGQSYLYKTSNVLYPGNDLLQISGDYDTCAYVCDTTVNCIGFTFPDPHLNYCLLKSFFGTPVYVQGGVTYSIQGAIQHDFFQELNTVYYGDNLVVIKDQSLGAVLLGSDSSVMNANPNTASDTPTVLTCQFRCERTPGCLVYQVSDANPCILQGGDLIRGHQENITSYVMSSQVFEHARRRYSEYHNSFYTGVDLLYWQGPILGCAHACAATPRCVAFIPDSRLGKNCWFKSSIEERIYKTNSTTYAVHGILPRQYLSEANVQYQGFNLVIWEGPQDQCKVQCAQTPGCVAYEIIESQGCGCVLKAALGERVYVAGITTYISAAAHTQHGRLFVLETSIEYPDNDIMYWEGAHSECGVACYKTEGCLAFVLDREEGDGYGCWFKGALHNRQYRLGASTISMAGSTYRQFLIETDVFYQDNDLLYWPGPFADCEFACSKTPACVAYQLDIATGANCWFKSSLGPRVRQVGAKIYVMVS